MSSAEALAAALAFPESEHFRNLADTLPAPIYTTDAIGRINYYNQAAAKFWGRHPQLGTTYWCGSWKLYRPDGTLLPLEKCPVAIALKEKRSVRGLEAIAERPDGTRVTFEPYPTPMFDTSGKLIGAINILIDVSDRKETEAALRRQTDRLENLNRIVRGLTSDLDLERIVQAATHGAGELSGASFGAFFCNKIDDKGERSILYALSDASRELFSKFGLPRNAAIFEPTFRGERSVCSDDIRKDARYSLTPHYGMPKGDVPIVSYLAVPVVSRSGEVHGALFFGHEKSHVFTAETQEIVETIAANTAIAIDNANLLGAAEREIEQRKRTEQALAERIREQGALYQFTDRVHHARSLQEIYDAAIDSICGALGCDRASILLFDKANVMRFVAWRGLSSEYRAAVEGHSPWTAGTKDPEPVAVVDVSAADLSGDLRAVVQEEGIGALAFIPLVANGSLIGKFMIYYPREHAFAERELVLSVAIARQLAFSIARLRAEDAVRQKEVSERQLASIVESSDDAIVSKDLNGIVTSWNTGAQRIFGYTADEMIGKPIATIIPAERQEEEPEILRRLRRGERVDHFETIRQRKNGTLLDISLTISPLKDAEGRVVGASKIARDITERKRAEVALRDSEQRLQELLTAVPVAIYTTDAEGTITYYNEAAVALSGHRPRIGIDKWCVSWKLYWPDGTPLPHDQCPMAIALREGRIVRNVEAIAERPDGSRVPFIPFPTPLRDSSGKVVGAVNILVDISERRQSETHQRLLLRELNHRVKNNMQILHVLLSSSLRASQNPEARDVLEDASRRVGAMAAAQQVLYGTTSGTSFQADEFLQIVCRTAQQTFGKDVKIKIENADGSLTNDAAAPLALILNELMTNAVKHGLSRQGGEIRVGITKHAETFMLYVEDDGPGFKLEEIGRKTSGLALVQALARQLQGRIEVTRANCTRCIVSFSEHHDAET